MSYVWPIKGRITQGFGPSSLGVEPSMYAHRNAGAWARARPVDFPAAERQFKDFHPGIDIACKVGTPVLAPANGTIIDVHEYWIVNPFVGFKVPGLYIAFRFEKTSERQAVLLVDHLSDARNEGRKVLAGHPIAWTGSSGASSGPHAHLEVRTGTSRQALYPSAKWFRENPDLFLKGE